MRNMVSKWKVFGTGVVLFALFWCSVANMPTVSASQGDIPGNKAICIWVNQYNGYANDLSLSHLDAYGSITWKGFGRYLAEDKGWTLSSCNAIQNTQGLHIVNGFVTDCIQYGTWTSGVASRGYRYAVYLYQTGYENGYLKSAVGYAWERATIHDALYSKFPWEHYYIVAGSIAPVGEKYIEGQFAGYFTRYFYNDTITSPLVDPVDSYGGTITKIYKPWYYSWVCDT
ncbi:MAG: hypothetical protein N3F63_05280 [Thermoplasmata archaeon]|nr:hypothetical protein [Thermoplasmata archaeon]